MNPAPTSHQYNYFQRENKLLKEERLIRAIEPIWRIFLILFLFTVSAVLFSIFGGLSPWNLVLEELVTIAILIYWLWSPLKEQWITCQWENKGWFLTIGSALTERIFNQFIYPLIADFFQIELKIGASQGTIPYELTTTEYIVKMIQFCITGPFLEEFLFRWAAAGLIPLGIYIFAKDLLPSYSRWAALLVIQPTVNWVVFGIPAAALFAIAHGPTNIASFLLYFPGGLIKAYLFSRYGLLAAFLSHGIYNLTGFIDYGPYDGW